MTSVRDIMVISILLLVVGVSMFFVVDMGHRVNTQILSTPIIANVSQASTVINSADTAIDSVDYIYLALFIAFFISIVITGWFVGGVPIAAPIYFFVVVIFSFVSVILQLVWQDLSTNPTVISTTLSLPITTFILNNLGYFVVAMGLVGILAMFAKPAGQSGY